MSKIGEQPVKIEDKVEVDIKSDVVVVKGPKGEISVDIPSKAIKVEEVESELIVTRANEEKTTKSLHGTIRSLLSNAMVGVTEGYTKTLEIHGVAYRVAQKGKSISLSLGLNHDIEIDPIDGVEFEVPDETTIIVKGIDKQRVGEMAAFVREKRKPEPYKGKGIRYKGEYVRRKTPKAVKASAA